MTDTAQIHIRHEPLAGSPLALDYLARRGEAVSFFPGNPYALQSFREKLEEVGTRFGRAERERAARAVRPTSPAARDRLRRFVEQGGAMITTGQQAGILSGPLYTVYKALTAARLADELERHLGTTIVPVFWVASDDHDWAEVNHALLGVPANGVRRVELSEPPSSPKPMSAHRLGEGVIPVLDELSEVLEGLPFGAEVLTLVRSAYTPDQTVAGAFAALLEQLLSSSGVCITEASHPVVKEASTQVLQHSLRDAADHERLLVARTRELAECRYAAQVAVLEGATNVFYHGDAGRVRLYRAGSDFAVPESGERFDRATLLERVGAEPGRFSPNVFLRPVVESTVFPTLAYVGGPGEISYFAQITALFPAFGVGAPVVYPRASVTLIEPAMQRLLDKLGLTLEELSRPAHELVDELARRAMPPEVAEVIEELSRAVTDGYRRLIEVAGAVDPTLDDALASLRNQVLARIGDSEKKVVRQLKRKEEIAVGQLERARANLRPDGAPQDRVLNLLPFLARYGSTLLEEIAASIRPEFS